MMYFKVCCWQHCEEFEVRVEFNLKLLFLDDDNSSHVVTENQYDAANLTTGLEKVSIAACQSQIL